MQQVATAKDLGLIIRNERKRQGFTQTELAGLSNVGITFLSNLENGKETAEIGKAIAVTTMLGIDLFAQRKGL